MICYKCKNELTQDMFQSGMCFNCGCDISQTIYEQEKQKIANETKQLQKMKEQQKISYLFSNKHVKLLEILVSNLFYYLCWVIIGIYFISMSINIISLYFDPYDTDGCMDTGICKEGFTFNDCGDGKPCTITKESCLKNNNIWLEDIHSCDTKHKVR